jgi:hypothetical protein
MAFSQTASFADVLRPNLAELTTAHVVAFVTHTDAAGRWLFGRQLLDLFDPKSVIFSFCQAIVKPIL